MSTPDYDAFAAQLRAAADALNKAADIVTQAPPTPPADTIKTPAELDAALAAATPGAVLVLDPHLVYPTPLTITADDIMLMNAVPVTGRATLDTQMPLFKDGITVNGQNVTLVGLEAWRTDPLTDIVVLNGPHPLLDGCRILGQVDKGAKRGIAGNAPNVVVRRCYVEDCFQFSPGNDSQAFAAWNSPGPFLLENNYLSGGSETVLFGGADPQDVAHIPTGIVIRGNTITKRPTWQPQNIGVKNTLELKNAIDVQIEDNDIEYSWGGHGQDGYLLMLTPRNQDGGAPYSTVKNVRIVNNRFRHAAAAIAMLGHDAPNTSGPLEQLTIADNEFIDIDPVTYSGSDKLIFVGDGPKHITINHNAFAAKNVGSAVYLSGQPKALDLNITNNTLPPSTYGVMGASCAPAGINDMHGSAWTTFVQSGQLKGNILTP